MIGGHMIKAWSKTPNSISLSSAEAELIAMVKLSAELLGLMSLARDLDYRLHGRVWADSSAALAVVKRSGAGRQVAAHQHKLVVGPGTAEVEEARLREGSCAS